jgi:hypothetical protein
MTTLHVSGATLVLTVFAVLAFQQHHVAAQSVPPGCNLPNPAFCDTFDQPHPVSRHGQLDPSKWNVTRHSGLNGSNMYSMFVPSDAHRCIELISGVVPPNDVFMCGPEFGESMHFMDAFSAGGSYIFNNFRIQQPFDFANRTGAITFDVDAKTSGTHGWWIEMWVTDEPVPGPHFNTFLSPPRNGFGIQFAGECGTSIPAGDAGTAKSNPSEIVLVKNYNVIGPVITWRSAGGATMQLHDCYTTGPDAANHFKVLVNQSRIEVWATDAMPHPHVPGEPNYRKIATFDNLGLTFSRGFVHWQHATYNPGSGVSQSQTYHWDNMGFDGPILPKPRQYSLPDSLTAGVWAGAVNTGYGLTSTGILGGPKTISGVDLTGAQSAAMTFFWSVTGSSRGVDWRVNGGPWHRWDMPYNSTGLGAIVNVPLSELRQGDNTVDFRALNSSDAVVMMGIDLLVDGGAGTLPPTATPAATDTPAPVATDTPTPVPTNTSAPTSTPTNTLVPTSTATVAPTNTPVPPTVTSTPCRGNRRACR